MRSVEGWSASSHRSCRTCFGRTRRAGEGKKEIQGRRSKRRREIISREDGEKKKWARERARRTRKGRGREDEIARRREADSFRFNPQDMSNIAFAFSKSRYRSHRVFDILAQEMMGETETYDFSDFSSRQLAMLMVAYAKADYKDANFFRDLQNEVISRQSEMSPSLSEALLESNYPKNYVKGKLETSLCLVHSLPWKWRMSTNILCLEVSSISVSASFRSSHDLRGVHLTIITPGAFRTFAVMFVIAVEMIIVQISSCPTTLPSRLTDRLTSM
eukprot:733104-Hanusia_phi.AAC.1